MNEWQALALICILFIASWLLAFFTLRLLVDQVRKWLDVFLVEPAIARGNGPSQRSTNGDIYVEVIEVTGSGGGANNTVTRRDVPYLIR